MSEPLGMLYFSRELYGDDMVSVKEALESEGYTLEVDPLEEQAELVRLNE